MHTTKPSNDPLRKMRDSEAKLTSSSGGPRLNQGHYQGNVLLNPLQFSDDESDWDSELELDQALVREASRIQRKIPMKQTFRTPTAKKNLQSPYYCEEVGPQLDFGYQWPQSQQRESLGFVRVDKTLRKINPNQHNKRNDKSKLLQATLFLKETYFTYNPKFVYDTDKAPKRILTKPSRPVRNEDNDNENYDYILKVNEILGQDPNYQYRVIDLLGQGTFGQVVKCERISTGELFSVKVIKNKSAYKTQTGMEIEILKKLNKQLDPDDKHHIIRLFHVFNHKHHLCLVFELLSYNLYDLIGHNGYKGFPPETVRAFAVQILDTLSLLKEAKIIHCDLKPENILLESEKSLTIKVIDFGSSCHEANRIYTYLQSRFYRSPEVLLGMKYTGAIDMWSFGCIVAELFLGLPLFPGSSEYNQLFRIVEMLGVPPKDMLSKGRNTEVFFNKHPTDIDTFEYTLKSREQYSQENNKNELPRKKYFPYTKLDDIILRYNNGKPYISKEEEKTRAGSLYSLNEEHDKSKEMQVRECILDFLRGVLDLNPLKRWTPQQAIQHPFISQKPYTGPFTPDGYHIKPIGSISADHDTTGSLVKSPVTQRRRAESLGKPTAPDQLQLVVQKIHSPINKYNPKGSQNSYYYSSRQPPSNKYRQRNTRSQGDDVGLLSPEAPVIVKKMNDEKKVVTISPKVKIIEPNMKDNRVESEGEDKQKMFHNSTSNRSQQKWSMVGPFMKRRTIK